MVSYAPPGVSATLDREWSRMSAWIMHSDVHMSVVRVIDSHTGGEPTRVVARRRPRPRAAARWPSGSRPLPRRSFDRFRSAVVNEPRGSDVLVGALLCEPDDRDCARRRHLLQQRRLPRHVRPRHDRPRRRRSRTSAASQPGAHRIETPVGVVDAELHAGRPGHRRRTCQLSRTHKQVAVEVAGIGAVTRRRRLGRQLVLPRRATTS